MTRYEYLQLIPESFAEGTDISEGYFRYWKEMPLPQPKRLLQFSPMQRQMSISFPRPLLLDCSHADCSPCSIKASASDVFFIPFPL